MAHDQTDPPRWQVKPNAKRLLKQYEGFPHLRTHISQGSDEVITMCMNKHLLHGGTLRDLVLLAREDNRRLGSNDFLDEQRIKRHIAWCCEPQRGWLIQRNKFGVYRIVGYCGEPNPHIDAEHAVQESYHSISASSGASSSQVASKAGDPLAQRETTNELAKAEGVVPTRVSVTTSAFVRDGEIALGFGEDRKRMENLLKNLVSRFLHDDATWLAIAFKMTELISSSRGNRYGFEWPVQAAFGCFLLGLQENEEVSSVGVGKQESNKKKYDISFVASGKKVIVEIKTLSGGAISYAKSDVQKDFPEDSLPFFLIFSDPSAPSEAPSLTGTSTIGTWVTHEGLRCYLYRKNSEQQL
jgi:hypothetical protein